VRGERSGVRFELDLTQQLPEIELPDGARFHRMSDSDEDIAARAELHRDAWSVWGTSRFSEDRYRRLRESSLYDPDLDIVLEHEGRLVSYCICWIDTANGVGMFEPVGTRPSAAQRGYGRAVIREGFRRLRDRGMTIARVATGTINPPAVALYQSAGFTPTTHDRHFCLPAAKIGTE
jgi:ribosomal protein S18 acetylase RimI-like enzyme